MNILIGVCGLGNGHIIRQTAVINFLLSRGHQLFLAVPEDSLPFLNDFACSVSRIPVSIPWVATDNKGVDYEKTLDIHMRKHTDYFASFLRFAERVSELSNNKMDIVITDYEPNVAFFSYANNIPLVGMEQQSKYLFLPPKKVCGIGNLEESSRLRLFFPHVSLRIISSFFPLPESDRYVLIPPILRRIQPKKSIQEKILIYISPYCKSRQVIDDLINAVSVLPFQFYLYSGFSGTTVYKNIHFRSFGDGFLDDMADCSCIISTAGHQLISEAIMLEKPLLLMPLPTYEQNYNCQEVVNGGMGKRMSAVLPEEIQEFTNHLATYAKAMVTYKATYWKKEWETCLEESIISLCKKEY